MKYFQLVSTKKGLSVALLGCSIFALAFETTALNASHRSEQCTISPALRRFYERLILFAHKKYTGSWMQFCQESINDLTEDNAEKHAELINCLRTVMAMNNKSPLDAKKIGNCLDKHLDMKHLPGEFQARMPKLSATQAFAVLQALRRN